MIKNTVFELEKIQREFCNKSGLTADERLIVNKLRAHKICIARCDAVNHCFEISNRYCALVNTVLPELAVDLHELFSNMNNSQSALNNSMSLDTWMVRCLLLVSVIFAEVPEEVRQIQEDFVVELQELLAKEEDLLVTIKNLFITGYKDKAWNVWVQTCQANVLQEKGILTELDKRREDATTKVLSEMSEKGVHDV